MTNATLIEYEDHWPTELGGVSVLDGTVTFRGHDLLNALEDLSWMDLLMYGITGRRFSQAQLELFQGLWKVSVSYPEPRIWNNRVAALGGSTRSPAGLSLGAAIAVTDATIYGQRPMIGAFDFLLRAHAARQDGVALSEFVSHELKTHRTIPGYGRPIRSVDERLAPAERLAKRLGLWGGTHTQIAQDIAEILQDWRMGMNIAAIAGALYADQGLTATQYGAATILAFSAGMIVCQNDASTQPSGALFPLRCSRLRYSGPMHRAW